MFNKNFYEIHKLTEKLNARKYRLLGKYRQGNNLIIVGLKEGISNSGMCIREDYIYNERETIGKKRESNRDTLNNSRNNKEATKNKYSVFGGNRYSYFEKKIFNELDNREFLEKNKTISNRTHKKINFKKRKPRFSLGLFFSILIFLVPLIDLSLYFVGGKDLLSTLGLLTVSGGHEGYFPRIEDGALKNLLGLENYMFREALRVSTILKYCIPIFIIFVFLVLGIVFYYKKVMKYEKIKFREKLKEY
ncbi:Plasmodium exported protein (Pm-fam-a like), unknown function [Plasmodium malariae]|uniref:Fam-l protein n=1 Tax=Plasmodium malariae TaxID=5858 RepID=A0A1A8WK51_PLAMA|nr:Plasmodium exported protein (Pm-fam-a like), unknown function [Plasmodium malariae]